MQMEWNENVKSEAGEPGISEMSQAIYMFCVCSRRQYHKETLHTVATYALPLPPGSLFPGPLPPKPTSP